MEQPERFVDPVVPPTTMAALDQPTLVAPPDVVHSVHNRGSCGVAAGAGFVLEGTQRSGLLHADGWHDMHMHARLRTDPERL